MKIHRIFDESSTENIEQLFLAALKETINDLINDYQAQQKDTATSSIMEDAK